MTWQTLDQLSALAERALADHRAARLADARRRGGLAHLLAAADHRLRLERTEYLDRPDCPPETKLRLVRALHRQNRLTGTYRGFLRALEPALRRAADARGRRARVLELASGYGAFTLALAREVGRRALPAALWGSDIVPEYVRDANHRARLAELPVRFEVLDALDLSALEPGEFDVIFIAQTLHHFTPGQLARVVAEGRRVATTAFVGIDGARRPRSFAGLPLIAALGAGNARDWRFAHDAAVSLTTLYSDDELHLLGRLAAPDADVTVTRALPSHSVLSVSGAASMRPLRR